MVEWKGFKEYFWSDQTTLRDKVTEMLKNIAQQWFCFILLQSSSLHLIVINIYFPKTCGLR